MKSILSLQNFSMTRPDI